MHSSLTCDLFCTVVDNYGDIGVCWRLARQLVQEHGCIVRLWVDDLTAFHRLCPEIDVQGQHQRIAGVDILHWDRDAAALPAQWTPGEMVIEAFACDLQPGVLDAMARQPHPPVWLNLEYLSAEPWVREHHALASPHPRLPLVRHFFFPGFEPGTGGLIHETGLEQQQQAFGTGTAGRQRLWHQLGIAPPPADACLVSLFAYANRALPSLLEQWRIAPQPVVCLVPEGLAATQIGQLLGAPGQAMQPASGVANCPTGWQGGNLTILPIPFVRQERYDELLWACDVNFVRGEDSFVRAQWARKPFVWQIYPQAEEAHIEKLDAFLARYLALLPAREADVVRNTWHAWNDPVHHPALDWAAFYATLATQRAAAAAWAARLLALGDLAANLVAFCENRLK
ncbi:elongation factor P maturation arginine rhamnosyltransferase EarP [Imbroritus primus]|uniref:elongation factor P maturation arginine rhamnosyltransferase EarP n=1 Tax=Imbroritus primus TaxID=3058603 RepID=UPI003D161FB8